MNNLIQPHKITGWQFFNENVEKSADVVLVPLEYLEHDNRAVADLFVCALSGYQKVIDVGCGGGFPGVYVSQYVDELVGIDAAPNVIAVATEQTSQIDARNAVFTVGDATAMTFMADEFDGAMLCGVLESMDWTSVDQVMSETQRVLKPGGKIAILDRDWEHIIEDNIASSNMIIRENGRLLLRTTERYYHPHLEKTTWHEIEPLSNSFIITNNILGSNMARVITEVTPNDISEDIKNVWFDECAQFDTQTIYNLLMKYRFSNITIKKLPIWGNILFVTAMYSP